MSKGYWVAHVDVTDPEQYKQYIAANAAAFAKFGGRFLVRGGASKQVDGEQRQRHVVIEFASYQQALDCWDSPEYQHALALRRPVSVADVTIVEGYDGPQPGA
jgi:uncharacterized protein (DUF1330 family)